jgi:hypothetical protein
MRYAMRLLCLLLVPVSAHAIGTVFYSPQERKVHDETTQVYTINGIVKRTDQKSVIWINGRPVNQNDPAFPGLRIFGDHVLIDGVPIKVGESKDTAPEKTLREKP